MIPDMFLRCITVKLVYTGSTIRMEVSGDETAGDIVSSAAEYFRVYPEYYILKYGKYLLRNEWTVEEMRVPHDGAVFEIVPDPNCSGLEDMEMDHESLDRIRRTNEAVFKAKRLRSRNSKKDEGLWSLAQRIAVYMEAYDPYGFMDALETGESMEDGRMRCILEVYDELSRGNFSVVRKWVYDPGVQYPEMRKEMKLIMKELKRQEKRNR